MITKIHDFKSDITLQALLDALFHDVIIVSIDGIISYTNIRARSNLFKNIDFTDENLNEISEVFNKLFQKYQITNKEFLLKAIEETKNPMSFVTESGKIAIKEEGSTNEKYYEVTTHPIFSKELGLIGRIWQFRDRTISENIENMKTEFLSIASHQLRTPISVIRGYTDMLKNEEYGRLPEYLKEPIESIYKSATKMNELINDLLNISRLQNGQISINKDNVNVYNLCNEIIESLRTKADKKQIKFNLKFSIDKSFVIQTDKLKLQEILKNLSDNAIKYSFENSEVDFLVYKKEESLVFEIIDKGIGIPQDQQDKLFTKFFRADNVLTQNFDGTGLGLYYVKNATEQINGHITFESIEGKGSTFSISLPIVIQ